LRFTDVESTTALAPDLEDLARDLLARSEAMFDPESPQTLRAKLALAHAVGHRGDLAQAAKLCRSILAASVSRLGACHGVRTDAMTMLARALYRLGDPQGAAESILQELQCSRTASNPLILLGHMYEAMPFLDYGGRWAEGEAVARETSDLLKEYGGGHGAMLIGAESHIARFVSLQGRLDEAEELFKQLVSRIENGEVSEEPNFAARIRLHYGAHLVKRNRLDEAEQQLLEVLRIQGDPRLGTWDSIADDVLNELITFYRAKGNSVKVREYEQMREEALRRPTF
jgi:tetratricopeptide (TPR) repeat protein